MIITTYAYNTKFIFNDWVGYRTSFFSYEGQSLYPDFMRISNEFSYWDVEVGLVCISKSKDFALCKEKCFWQMYTTLEFDFLKKIYNNMYPEKVSYDNIELAKSRIDNLLLKSSSLGCFL